MRTRHGSQRSHSTTDDLDGLNEKLRIFDRYDLWNNEDILARIITCFWVALGPQVGSCRESILEKVAIGIKFYEPSIVLSGRDVHKVYMHMWRNQGHPQNPIERWEPVCHAYLVHDSSFSPASSKVYDISKHTKILRQQTLEQIAAVEGKTEQTTSRLVYRGRSRKDGSVKPATLRMKACAKYAHPLVTNMETSHAALIEKDVRCGDHQRAQRQ